MEKICAINIRSSIKKSGAIRRALSGLGLRRLHSCIILDKTDSNMGALKVAESVLTYGEINRDALKKLLSKRARVSNSKKYAWDEQQLTSFLEDFTSGKKSLSDMKIKRVFNLHPPIKGFGRKSKKTPYNLKGTFGYRGTAINALLERMI